MKQLELLSGNLFQGLLTGNSRSSAECGGAPELPTAEILFKMELLTRNQVKSWRDTADFFSSPPLAAFSSNPLSPYLNAIDPLKYSAL